MDISSLRQAVNLIREATNLKMPIQCASILIEVALQPGINNTTLADIVGVSEGSVSRHLDMLTTRGKSPDFPGWGLVERYIDPWDRKGNHNRLTPKGEALFRKIAGIGGRKALKAV